MKKFQYIKVAKARITIPRLLRKHFSSLHAFSYSAQSIPHIALKRFFSFHTFSYSTYCHYFNSIIHCVNVPNFLPTSKPRILVWPLQLQVAWGMVGTPPSPSPHAPTLTLPPPAPSLLCWSHFQPVAPPPDPNPPPQTLSVSLEVWDGR